MKNLESTFKNLMTKKHELKANGADWKTLDLIDDALVEIKNAIESNSITTIESKVDSMFL